MSKSHISLRFVILTIVVISVSALAATANWGSIWASSAGLINGEPDRSVRAKGDQAGMPASTPQYEIVDIGLVGMTDTASQGFGVSDNGIAVGTSIRTGANQAFNWTDGGGIAGLPNIAARDFCRSNGATNAGVIVGTCSTTFFGSSRLPVIWQSGAVSQLPLPSGETLGDAWDVNSSNVAVGSVNGGSLQRGAMFAGGVGSILTQTTGNGSYFQAAYGINDAGLIAGVGLDPNNASINVAIVHDTTANTTFGITPLSGDTTALAFGVGNGGHVVGSSGFTGRPFVWTQAGGTIEVPLPSGTTQGSARGVNSAGWVVGTASSAFAIPFLWDGTTTYRIGDLIPAGNGWDLLTNTSSSAMSIGDNGVIVGTGVLNGAVHAYALVPVGSPTPTATPTPVPGTLTVDRTDDNGAASACTSAANDCSLRGAVNNANADAANNFINFDPVVFASAQTITLAGAELVIANNGSLSIDGPGAGLLSVSGGGVSRVFSNSAGAVATLEGIRITGGQGGQGGGLINTGGTITLMNVNVSGNSATNGGGLNNAAAGTMMIVNSVISGNTSVSSGGAMQNVSTSTLRIIDTEFSGNTSNGTFGGGAIQGGGDIHITNSTLSNNIAAGGDGGAISYNGGTGRTIVLSTTTIANNSAFDDGGGLYKSGSAASVIRNSIIALNTNTDALSPDVSGTFVSGGTNLIGIVGTGFGFTGPGDQVGTAGMPIDPMLGPLSDNGGATQTRALLAGSTAINAGNNALALDLNGMPLATDQRGSGFARIVNSIVDIGAFEVQGGATPTPTATPTSTPTATPTATPTGTPTATPTPSGAIVNFSAATFTEDESQTFTTNLIRTGNTTVTSTVTFMTADGTAVGGGACTPGVDYVIANQPITFNPGVTQSPVMVAICADGLAEAVFETVNLSITGPDAGNQNTAVLSINDTASMFRNASPINFQFANTVVAPETNPYPSNITVTGGPLQIGGMRVTLYDLWHSIPDNVDILLVGPGGQAFVIMGDAGGTFEIEDIDAVTLTFQDAQPAVLPNAALLTTGKYEPTTWETPVSDFEAPAPAGPYNEPGSTIGGTGTQTFYGTFGLTNSNGVWSLYVRDDQGNLLGIPGQIAGGWGIDFLPATAAQASITGRVMTADGLGIRNAEMVITGNSIYTPLRVRTSSFGYYSFEGLQTGETYVLTVNSQRFTFQAPSRVISLTDNAIDMDFVADPPSAP